MSSVIFTPDMTHNGSTIVMLTDGLLSFTNPPNSSEIVFEYRDGKTRSVRLRSPELASSLMRDNQWT